MPDHFASGVDETWEPGFDQRERDVAMLCHLIAIVGYLTLPLGNIIGPLVVWRSKRETMPFVRYHGRQAVNFQATMVAWFLATVLLVFPVILIVDGLIGMSTSATIARLVSGIPGGSVIALIVPLACVPLVVGMVLPVVGAIRARQGRAYQYPIAVRFIK